MTLTVAHAARYHVPMPTSSAGKSPLDQLLNIFAEVRAGEGRQLLLLLVNIFAILFAYYILKPVREGLLSGGVFGLSGTDSKVVLTALSAGLLLFVIPLYSMLVDRLSRIRLLNVSMGFVLVSLVAFFILGRAEVNVGGAYYLWLSIVNVFLIAQFWSYANDLYTEEAGKRLFAVIAIGMSGGAIAGSYATTLYEGSILWLLLGAGGILVIATLLYNIVDWQSDEEAPDDPEVLPDADNADEPTPVKDKSGAFKLIFSSKYLFLIAAMILLTNVVNTSGEFILFRAADAYSKVQHPDSEFAHIADQEARKEAVKKARRPVITKFYGDFFFWVNLIGFLVQAFLVSRIFKFIGIRAALFILPVIAFGGYALIALLGIGIVRYAKIAENSTDYSLQNTVKQALWLPTTREEKYKAKAAIDTFFVRGGDLLAAGVTLALTGWFGFGLKGFAAVNVGFVALWLIVTVAIAREHKKISKDEEPTPAEKPELAKAIALENDDEDNDE